MEIASFRHEIGHGTATGMAGRWRGHKGGTRGFFLLGLPLIDARAAHFIGMGKGVERLQIAQKQTEARAGIDQMVSHDVDDTMGLLQASPQGHQSGTHDNGTIALKDLGPDNDI